MSNLPKVPTEKGNLGRKIAYNVYPHSENNEVRAQVSKAKKGKAKPTVTSVLHNVVPKKLPKAKY